MSKTGQGIINGLQDAIDHRRTDKHIEEIARAIRPEAWIEEPTALFRGMQPKGTSQDDVLKAWWHAHGDQRYDARIRARAAYLATLRGLMEPGSAALIEGAKAMSGAMTHGEAESAVIYGQPKDVFQAMISHLIAEADSAGKDKSK